MTIEATIFSIVAKQVGITPSEIGHDSTVIDLGIDSIDAIEIIMEIEDEYDIEIEDADWEKWRTVGDATRPMK